MKKIDFKNLHKYLHEVPSQAPTNEIIQKIRSMDSHTAYALLGGYLASLLQSTSASQSNLPFSTSNVHLQSASNSLSYLRSESGDKTIFFLLNQLLSIIDVTIKDLRAGKLAPGSQFIFIGEGPYLKRLANLIIKEIENRFSKGSTLPEFEKKLKQIKDIFEDNDRLREDYVNESSIDESIRDLQKLKEIIKDLHPYEERLKLKELEDRVNKIVREKDKKIDELNKKIDKLTKDEAANLAKITRLEKEIQDLKDANLEKDQKISKLEKELREAKGNLTKVTTEKDATIAELQKELEEKKTKIKDLENTIDNLNKKIKDQNVLDQRLKDLEKEKDRLQKEKDQLEKDKTKLEKDKGIEITNLKERLTNLEKKIEELEKLREKEVGDLEGKLKEVKDKLEIKEKEIKNGKIDEMAKELPNLQKLLEELEKGGIDLKDLSKLRDKLDNLNRLTKDGKDAVEDLEDLQKKINELREELKKQKLIELEKQEKQKEVTDRENKLDDLQLEILKLRRELKDLESLKGKDLTDLREKLEKLEKLKKEVGDSNDKVKELEDEVNKLRRELNKDKQDELDRLKEISDKEKEIERKKKEEEINKIKEIELEELKKKRGMMDAYVFMIVVFLTQLHTKQAEKLKAHGETLQKISRIFDQWNVIQKGLNTISQKANVILRWIKERKVDSNYTLYTDSDLSRKETDPHKLAIWNTFKSFLPDLQKNVKELRRILDEVRPDLPDSAKTLLDTMYKLSGKLLDIPDIKGDNDLTSYLKVTTQSEGEIKISKEIEDLKAQNKDLLKKANTLSDEMSAIRDDIGETRWNLTDGALKFFWPSYYTKKQTWNEKHNQRSRLYTQIDANNKRIQEKQSELRKEVRQKIALPDKRLTILDWISDSDQTQFKAYMDNLAQGVTALTSISNMAQQELQIDTQYYNSLLGLQKAGMDSLTRTIQGIVANMR